MSPGKTSVEIKHNFGQFRLFASLTQAVLTLGLTNVTDFPSSRSIYAVYRFHDEFRAHKAAAYLISGWLSIEERLPQ